MAKHSRDVLGGGESYDSSITRPINNIKIVLCLVSVTLHKSGTTTTIMTPTVVSARPIIIVTGANKYVYVQSNALRLSSQHL